MTALAAAFAAADLLFKAVAERQLANTTVDLRLIQLRLAHNSGIAFNIGDTLPAWVILALTSAVIAGLAGYAWRAAPASALTTRAAGAAVLGGAVANLIDRAGDGVVTDYLHTGWWPTFNIADVYIVLGAAVLAGTMLASGRRRHASSSSLDADRIADAGAAPTALSPTDRG